MEKNANQWKPMKCFPKVDSPFECNLPLYEKDSHPLPYVVGMTHPLLEDGVVFDIPWVAYPDELLALQRLQLILGQFEEGLLLVIVRVLRVILAMKNKINFPTNMLALELARDRTIAEEIQLHQALVVLPTLWLVPEKYLRRDKFNNSKKDK